MLIEAKHNNIIIIIIKKIVYKNVYTQYIQQYEWDFFNECLFKKVGHFNKVLILV